MKSSLHWNAWSAFIAWFPVLLVAFIALLLIAKLLGVRPRKRSLGGMALMSLIVADGLYLTAFFDMPYDYVGRAWGIWVNLFVMIAISVGVVLSFVRPPVLDRGSGGDPRDWSGSGQQWPPDLQPGQQWPSGYSQPGQPRSTAYPQPGPQPWPSYPRPEPPTQARPYHGQQNDARSRGPGHPPPDRGMPPT